MEWSGLLTASAGVAITTYVVWRWMRKKQERKTEEPSTESSHISTVPYKQPVAIHDIVSDKNGNGNHENGGYSNKAFHKEEIPITSTPQTITDSKLVKRNTTKRQESLISNLSEVFRVPDADEKSLSELVIEEYDHKTKTLRKSESLDLSQYRTDGSDHEVDIQHDNDTLSSNDVNKRLQSSQNDTESPKREDTSEAAIHVDSIDAVSPKSDITLPKDKNTKSAEWRDRLKDLLNDDDEEFIDESSEEEDDDLSSMSGTSVSIESVEDIDANTKGAKSSSNAITSQSSVNKLLGERALVIDNGSYEVRGGWAGEFTPTTTVRNVIGHWRAEASEAWQEALGSKFVGATAIERHSTLALEHPIDDGKINNWRGLQDVWSHISKAEMDADFTQQPVLITEPALVDVKQRERMVEAFIETLRVPGVCLRSQAAMCSLSAGHKVALVVNCCHGTTEIVPMYEGYNLNHVTTTLGVGGRHITEYLTRLVQREHGVSFTSVAELEIMNTIKETYASVESEKHKRAKDDTFEYELPDGQVIQLGSELSLCTEPLFKPGLVGNSTLGLPMLVKQTLHSVDPEMLAESENTILLAGGTSSSKGLQERLQEGLVDNATGTELKVNTTSCKSNAAWIGASILAEQSGFGDLCITEDMYFEHGANVVHRWCF